MPKKNNVFENEQTHSCNFSKKTEIELYFFSIYIKLCKAPTFNCFFQSSDFQLISAGRPCFDTLHHNYKEVQKYAPFPHF